MADINDRLDRLHRREEFDRRSADPGWTPRPATAAGAVTRPAGVDDRLGEVLDAVAAVVRRHPGLSVMVAVADGRAGRPVVRVTERDGAVETGVIVVGSGTVPAASPPPVGMPGPAAVPAVTDPLAVPEPAILETATVPDLATVQDPSGAGPGTAPPDPRRSDAPFRDDGFPDDRGPDAGARRGDGRHAAPRGDEQRSRPGAGWSGTSWHNALWSNGAQSRFRSAEGGPPMPPGHRRPESAADPDRLRLVPGEQPDGPQGEASGTTPLPEDPRQVVSRLAELLRENPSLPSDWSREAPE